MKYCYSAKSLLIYFIYFCKTQRINFDGMVSKRHADLQVCPNGREVGGCTYFEFKSVRKVPPPNFDEQFAKDLLIDEVTNLNQLKCIFDGKKIPEGYDFKGKMKKAIEKMDIPKEALKKFGKESVDELKNDIIKNFDNIFQVK